MSGKYVILLLAAGVALVVLITAALYFITLDEGPVETEGLPSSARPARPTTSHAGHAGSLARQAPRTRLAP